MLSDHTAAGRFKHSLGVLQQLGFKIIVKAIGPEHHKRRSFQSLSALLGEMLSALLGEMLSALLGLTLSALLGLMIRLLRCRRLWRSLTRLV